MGCVCYLSTQRGRLEDQATLRPSLKLFFLNQHHLGLEVHPCHDSTWEGKKMSEDHLEFEASLGYHAKREGVGRKGKKKINPGGEPRGHHVPPDLMSRGLCLPLWGFCPKPQ